MKNRKIVVSVLGILGIVLATIGVTYAFFSYSKTGTKENKISSGKVTFLFTESSQGITLTDAMPMTDDQGKAQTGEGKVFDFRVTSSVGSNMRIPYTVTVKPDSSVIPAEYIKLYLTDQLDNEIEPVRTLSSLDNYSNTITGLTGEKVLYEGEVPAGNTNYNKLFRLRMWIADNIDMNEGNTGIGTYNGATFSLKVNVYGEGVTTTQTEAERRANASIESVTVDGSNVTVVDSTHYTSHAYLAAGSESIEVPIVVDTVNDNAQVKIERINNQSSNINESKVKKVAATKNVTVYPGTNQFKITVTPEDKSDPTVYYLTITVDATYTITYNLNGGTQGSNSVTAYTVETATFDLPIPTKNGYNFVGWYDNSGFNGYPIVQVPQGTQGNKTYYARWYEGSFYDDEWSTIVTNIQNGNGTLYFPVNKGVDNQSKKPVELTFVVNNQEVKETHYLRVANVTSCADALIDNPNLTSTTACGFVVEFSNIISFKKFDSRNNFNGGGYPGSNVIFNYVTDTVYNSLPNEIKNEIIDTTVVSGHGSNDGKCTASENRDNNCNYVILNQKLYLLDEQEVFGNNSKYNTAADNTRMLDYYSLNNTNSDRVKKKNNNYSFTWWLRSGETDAYSYFRTVKDNGSSSGQEVLNELGVSPAFRIG